MPQPGIMDSPRTKNTCDVLTRMFFASSEPRRNFKPPTCSSSIVAPTPAAARAFHIGTSTSSDSRRNGTRGSATPFTVSD